jgi:hypothetical protein
MPPPTLFSGLVGLARTDITPRVGIYCRNWGAATTQTARGIHRPLLLSAIAVRESAASLPLVLLDADLGWWTSLAHERGIRQRVQAALGLTDERLLTCVTHTHSAPPLCPPADHWQGGDLLAAYHDQLEQAMISTARAAIDACEPAVIDWTRGRCSLAADRDLPDPSPRANPRLVCGYNPAQPADDTVVVARITATTGKLLGTITNYACHPTTLAWQNELVSPDYVGAMRETIEQAVGGLSLFLQGASGELAPRYQYVGDPAVADAHGAELGYAVLAAMSAMEPPGEQLTYSRVVESGAPLAIWERGPVPLTPRSTSVAAIRRTVDIPLKNWPTTAELAEQFAGCSDNALKERLRRQLHIREGLGDGQTFPLELWGWRVGEALLLGTLAESYSSIQANVRNAFPDRELTWLNIVNGWAGYLPPAARYDEDVYQVWQTPFDRGSLELVESAAIDLGRELLIS